MDRRLEDEKQRDETIEAGKDAVAEELTDDEAHHAHRRKVRAPYTRAAASSKRSGAKVAVPTISSSTRAKRCRAIRTGKDNRNQMHRKGA